MKKKALAVISGGLDSTVALYMARKKFRIAKGLFFNYGQKALPSELRACRRLSRRLSFPLDVIDLRWISFYSKSSLTKGKVPVLRPGDLRSGEKLRRTARSVTVENRNMIFLSCAAGIALESGCSALIAGFNAEEAVTFPDNSEPFLSAMNKAFRISAKPKSLSLACPTIRMTKKAIVRYALANSIALDTVYSCYLGKPLMCGTCESCIRLKQALRENDALANSGLSFEK